MSNPATGKAIYLNHFTISLDQEEAERLALIALVRTADFSLEEIALERDPYQESVTATKLPPKTDLREALERAREELIAAGHAVEDIGSAPMFFFDGEKHVSNGLRAQGSRNPYRDRSS